MLKIKINIKILPTIGVAIISSLLIAGGFIWFAKTTRAEGDALPYQYEIAEQSPDLTVEPGQPGWLVVKLKNTGREAWPIQQLSLNSVYFDGTPNRPSYFATTEWIDQMKILAESTPGRDIVPPHSTATFSIPIKAVDVPAIYQEAFNLQIGPDIVTGGMIKWLIQVGNTLNYQVNSGKQIQIWLSTQRLWAIENGVVIMAIPISSGRAGYGTPKGHYTVLNHKDTAYSAPYKLWMDYWMGLDRNNDWGKNGIGLHALPYWHTRQTKYASGTVVDGRLYQDGKVYEDVNHLGERMSHGCVRMGLDTARILYNWAPKGTPVTVA